MQTSAIKCSLSLNSNKSENSSFSCIFLAASAISLSSVFIALCHNNISSIGQLRSESAVELLNLTRFLFPVCDDSQAQDVLLAWPNEAHAVESMLHSKAESQLVGGLSTFGPSIQVKMTFIKQLIKHKIQTGKTTFVI